MLKLKEGWVEKRGSGNDSIADRYIYRNGHSAIDSFAILLARGNICAYADGGDAKVTSVDTIEQAHEWLLSVGSESPWEVASDSATVNDLDEFQTLAMRTAGDSSGDGWIIEKALGLSEETGEVLGLLKKSGWHGRELDRAALRKELGDVMWYVAALAHGHGFTLSEIATANIEKLRKRYPDGFSVERSLNRGDE